MLQVAVEQEVEDYLGRAHYRRGSRQKNGWCNGYEPGKVKTANGILEIDLPQLKATEEPYHSRLARIFREGSDILGKMVTEIYVRGLSTRDVESTFIQTLGQRLLSRKRCEQDYLSPPAGLWHMEETGSIRAQGNLPLPGCVSYSGRWFMLDFYHGVLP